MKKILLIEDHEDLRENTAEILSLSNYAVLKAENGKEGLEIARKEKPDLIICDIMMPVLDGYAVRNSLQQNPDLSDIPFIFLSALGDKTDIRKGMRAGADDYLTKPFEGVELLRAVETCLNKKDRYREAFTRKPDKDLGTFASVGVSTDQPFDFTDREIKEYRKKSMVYAEGQRPTNVYHILKGKVKTYIIHIDGKELITRIDGPGAFIGYTAMLEDINYRDNAQVLEDAELILVPRHEF
ncbi:MAG: response regulator, partial [Bacteroidota bacterium]